MLVLSRSSPLISLCVRYSACTVVGDNNHHYQLKCYGHIHFWNFNTRTKNIETETGTGDRDTDRKRGTETGMKDWNKGAGIMDRNRDRGKRLNLLTY